MDRLMLHIEKLLVNNEYVVVPGLGGFIVQNLSSQIVGNSIQSPSVTIGFNPLIKQEDGLLALSLSRDLKISYREAAANIRSIINGFKSNLTDNSYLTFGSLGEFKLDNNGKIDFEPSKSLYFLPGNLGYTSVQITKTEEKPNYSLNISNKFMKYAAILIIAFGLFFSTDKLNQGHQFIKADLLTIPTLTVNKSIEETTLEVQIEKNFHIVVAAFKSSKISDRFCNELKSQNFDNAHVIEGKRINKIAINSFSDQNQAEIALKSLRETNPEYKDAWILKN